VRDHARDLRAEPAARSIEDRLFRALAVLRAVLAANVVGVNAFRSETVEHPRLLVTAVVVMVAWTALTAWWYADTDRRTPTALGLDLAVAVGFLLATPAVVGEGWGATLPGFWVMAPMLAWAARWRHVGGLVAGLLVGGADVAVREELNRASYGNVFLLVIGGPIVGYLVASLQRVAVERDRAETAAAAAAERARLARAVHDGVLQVLALVQRRGHELGPDGAELARRAGEQEVALRRLIRDQDSVLTPDTTDGTAGAAGAAGAVERDVAAALSALDARPRTSVALPGRAVLLPAAVADEVVAAVGACLDNVDRHAGEQASAWVLLEQDPTGVTVTVRDNGPGIPDGRLEEALAAGRLGVSGSIRGRLADLGGEARLATGSWGTEWTLTVPGGPA